MKLLKLLTSIIIFFCPLYSAFEYSENSSVKTFVHRLPNYITPQHYDIQLFQEIYTNKFNFGICRVFIKIDCPTQNIYLHAKQPQIVINNFHLTNSLNLSNFYVPTRYTYYDDSDIWNIQFSVILLHGYYIIDIEYGIATETNYTESLSEIFVDESRHIISLLATHFQAIGARQIFPCWDDPAFQATFNISVVYDGRYFAMSNMPVQKTEMQHDRKVTYFVETPVMPTYRVAIMVFSYPYILNVPDNNMQFYAVHNIISYITFAIRTVANVMHHLKSNWKYYSISSKIITLKYVVAGFSHDCTENMGIPLYRDTVITYDNRLDPVAHKLNVVNTLTRSVICQSIDNHVTPSSWSFAWINEGISTLLTMDAINEIYPDSRVWDLFVVQIQQESLRLDTKKSIMKPLTSEANSPSEIKSLFSFSYYKKAPTILRMLKHIFTYIATEEVFQNGVKKFLQNHLANSDNLWAAMQTALDEYSGARKMIGKKIHVKEIMNPWTKFKHYPVLEVKQVNYTDVKISLENIEGSVSLDQQTLWIPVVLFKQNYVRHEQLPIYYSNMWLNSAEHDKREIYIPFDYSKDIIIVNVEQIGYYRVKYYDDMWFTISDYLITTHYTKIPVLNRAQLIDDAFYFLTQNQFIYDVVGFVKLVKYLQQETDYVAWYPMIKALEYMSCVFPFKESAYIKENMRNILGVLLKNIGYTEKPNDNELVKCLRQETAKWACVLNDQTCKENAVDKLKWHLDNPVKNKLLPWWRKWTYRNGLISPHDSNVTFWSMLNSWMNKSDNRLMEFLSCGVFPYNFSNYIMINNDTWENSTNYTVGIPKCNDESMQTKERVNCFFFIIAKYARSNLLLKYMLENLMIIKPREINIYAAFIVIINHLYSVELIDEVTTFIDSCEMKIQNYFHISLYLEDLIEENLKYKVNKCMKEFRNLTFSLIINKLQSKLKMRLSEITNQLNYFLPLIN